jgi:hypothetical protein
VALDFIIGLRPGFITLSHPLYIMREKNRSEQSERGNPPLGSGSPLPRLRERERERQNGTADGGLAALKRGPRESQNALAAFRVNVAIGLERSLTVFAAKMVKHSRLPERWSVHSLVAGVFLFG